MFHLPYRLPYHHYLERRLLHALLPVDGYPLAKLDYGSQSRIGVVNVIRAHRPPNMIVAHPAYPRTRGGA